MTVDPNDKAHRLALILQAIDAEERDFAEHRTEHKDILERLRNQAFKLRHQILTGQEDLPLEPATPPPATPTTEQAA